MTDLAVIPQIEISLTDARRLRVWLRKGRKRIGAYQHDVARDLGVTQSYISGMETGSKKERKIPTVDLAWKWAIWLAERGQRDALNFLNKLAEEQGEPTVDVEYVAPTA
jgi:transcriptional regulator with XRE-family HTH domain